VNSPTAVDADVSCQPSFLDADRLAQEMNDPKTLNLLMLGFALACVAGNNTNDQMLYCDLDDIVAILEKRLEEKPQLLQAAIRALRTGATDSMDAT
jgi:indolepyruvate ferredoxin oxidoreductase beta subunit